MIIVQNPFLSIFYKKTLFFVSNLGITFLNILFINDGLYVIIHPTYLSIQVDYPYSFYYFYYYTRIKYSLYKKLRTLLSNLKRFYDKKLSLRGVGFKSWLHTNKQKSNFLLLKIGFSFDLCFFIFSNTKFLCLKPTLILLKSLDKQRINQIASDLCKIKIWSLYKNKGIFYFDKTVSTKSIKSK